MSTIKVENLTGLSSGANANKIIVPSGQTLDASNGFTAPAGHVIQVKSQTWSTQTVSGGNTFADVASSAMSFTPKYSDSLIVIQAFMHIRWSDAASNGGACRLMYNGNPISSNATYANYDDHNSNTYQGYAIADKVTSGTTSSVIIKIQLARHSGGNFWVNWGAQFYSNMTVQEIKQ